MILIKLTLFADTPLATGVLQAWFRMYLQTQQPFPK